MILNGSRTTSDEYNRKVSEHRADNFSLAPFGRLSFTLLNSELNIANYQDLKITAHKWS